MLVVRESELDLLHFEGLQGKIYLLLALILTLWEGKEKRCAEPKRP